MRAVPKHPPGQGRGNFPRKSTPLAERLERYVIPEPMSGCWLWIGTVNGGGYGHIWDNAKGGRVMAHRASYEAHVGPIPTGLELDHLCRVHCCVNPGHLEPVTRRENLRRGNTVAARSIAATGCPQGHPYDAANTIIRNDGSRSCRACGKIRGSRIYRKQRRAELESQP